MRYELLEEKLKENGEPQIRTTHRNAKALLCKTIGLGFVKYHSSYQS